MNESIEEKAKSKAQQRFFGMVDAYKKGEMPNASKSIKDATKSMTKKEVKDFAKTKHKGLPNHVEESVQSDLVKTMGLYTQGKCNSKKANKAIMKLASIQESKREGYDQYWGESDALNKAEKCQENNNINFDKKQKELTMKKGGIIKESQLRQIIRESLQKILSENY